MTKLLTDVYIRQAAFERKMPRVQDRLWIAFDFVSARTNSFVRPFCYALAICRDAADGLGNGLAKMRLA